MTGPGPVRALSGADGYFEFDAPDMTFTADDGLPLRQKACLIAVAAGLAAGETIAWGHRVDWQTWLDRAPKTGTTEVQLARGDVPIRGRLLNGQGQPLVDAWVRVKRLVIPPRHDLTAVLDQAQDQSLLQPRRRTDYRKT